MKKKVSKVKRTIIPKKIESYNPITKERDMARESINEGSHGSQFMEIRDDGSKQRF